MDWRHKAVCRDEDPELFFPVGNSGPALAQIADAKLVCNRCPVTTECLTWALESGQDAGVWGGLSEDERRALKRRNARLAPAAPYNVAAPENPAQFGAGFFAAQGFSVDVELGHQPGASAQGNPQYRVCSALGVATHVQRSIDLGRHQRPDNL